MCVCVCVCVCAVCRRVFWTGCPDIWSFRPILLIGLLRMRASISHSISHAEQQYLMYVHYCKGRFRVVVGVYINKT